jgi:hypothetical protein
VVTEIAGHQALRLASVVDEATAIRLAARIGARRAGARDASARVRAYKQEVPAAYEAAPDGEKGAILQREGLDPDHGQKCRRSASESDDPPTGGEQ